MGTREQHDQAINAPRGGRLAIVPVVCGVLCCMIVLGALGSDKADLRSVGLASAWALLSSATAPVVWMLVRRVPLSVFMAITLGLSTGRTLIFGSLAGLFAWLVGVDMHSFWITFFAASGAMLVAEKALAVGAAWPAITEQQRTLGRTNEEVA